MSDIREITYSDINQSEVSARERLRSRLGQLKAVEERRHNLSSDERKEMERIEEVLAALKTDHRQLCEPLFIGVRDLFNGRPGLLDSDLGNHEKGVLRGKITELSSCMAALTLGLLTIEGGAAAAPPVMVVPNAERRAALAVAVKAAEDKAAATAEVAEKADKAAEAANYAARTAAETAKTAADNAKAAAKTSTEAPGDDTKSVAAAKAQTIANTAKAAAETAKTASESAKAAANTARTAAYSARDAAAAARQAAAGRIVADQSRPGWALLTTMFFAAIGVAQPMSDLALIILPLLARAGDPKGDRDRTPGIVKAEEFARVMLGLKKRGVTADEPQLERLMHEELNKIQSRGSEATQLGIDIPDFEDNAKGTIVPEHVQATGVFICGAMFDELKVFEVVDKLVELFQNGMLAVSSGDAGKQLYTYWKNTPNRMSDAERRNFYSMTMGIPGGGTTGMVNREFNDLWLRFVSSVSSFVRQSEVDRLLRTNLPSPISQQQVRKAARDLAVNLSLHGYGMAFHAALDLQGQIKFMIDLLGNPDIRSNYGARDMWQVVDQVATLELGGAKTSSRYRTLATCGAIITAWLAKNADRISRPGGAVIDMDEVRSPVARADGTKATTTPTDHDLVDACDLWLADTATGDLVIDQMSQPREAPAMTSRPVQIPSIAREMLADLPGMGLGYASTRH